jgi:hypothetical protein
MWVADWQFTHHLMNYLYCDYPTLSSCSQSFFSYHFCCFLCTYTSVKTHEDANYFILLDFTISLLILFPLYTSLIVCKKLPWVSSHKIQNTWPFILQILVKYYDINNWTVSHIIVCIFCAPVPICLQFGFRTPKFKCFVHIIIHCIHF